MKQLYHRGRRAFLALLAIVVFSSPLRAQNRQIDESLRQLFATAEKNNTSLRQLKAATSEATAGIDAARADRLPDVSASVAFSYNGNARIWDRRFSNGFSATTPHFGNNYALKASQVVYAGGAIDASIRLAEQGAQKTILATEQARQGVRFALTGLYLQLHVLANRESVYRENAALAETLIRQTQDRRNQGTALQNDITRYELQHEQMLLGATQTEDARRIAAYQLATVLGSDSAVHLLPAEAFVEGGEANKSLDLWQQEAATGRTDIKQADLDVKISQTKEKLERSARLPKLAIVAEDQLNGPITYEVPPLNKNINFWYVGVGITYNFSSLYKNNRRIRQARLATQTAQAAQLSVADKVRDEVQKACIDYETAQSTLRTQKKNVELAASNYSVVAHRYANGLALITDMTDAANVKLSAELALADARINLVYCYYALLYAAGQL
jgi:outer membrane protein